MLRQFLFNSFFTLPSLGKSPEVGPVFVVGTGRSGTHFLCSCLNKFPDLDDCFSGRESPYMFHEISKRTVSKKSMPNHVFGYYKYMARKAHPKIFVDQTHPNIWNVEQLLEKFPNAKFLAISRDVRSVVYSMKLHEGVSKWIENFEQYPIPNCFLGISEENFELYKNELTSIQRAVFRWCSHEQRIQYLAAKFPKALMKVNYESLGSNMQETMIDVARFLGVVQPNVFKDFKDESLHKKDFLSEDELSQIYSAIDLFDKYKDGENAVCKE